VALLAFSFFYTLRYSRQESLRAEEYAYACDPFGYLRMAKQIRQAFSHGQWPQFKLESAQTETLIDFFRRQQLPLSSWEEVVAPHAHHYFSHTGSVGVQYPPGTGLALAVFPQGEAVYGLNRVVIIFFAVFGVGALLLAAWKQAWRSIGLLMLAFSFGLLLLASMGTRTFSINATLVPLLFTCLLSVLALWIDNSAHDKLAWLCAFLAGVALGFATLVRLPSFLLLPGFVVLLWPGFHRLFRLRSLALALVLGTILAGVLPVLINQHDVAGAWYLSTYADIDAAPPTLDRLWFNFPYFLGRGPAAVDNRILLYAIVGFVGFVLLYVRRDSNAPNKLRLTWRRLALSAALLWLVSICYFLTHIVTAPHYMIPSIFATVTLLGIGTFALELADHNRFDSRRVVSWVALLLILAPGVVVLRRAWRLRSAPAEPVIAQTHPPLLLPAELASEKAWIWADLLTGSFWYYANKPAFKIQISDPQTRAKLFRFVFDRGEPQYLIQDSEQMKVYMHEIGKLGGTLELRGRVDGRPYYLVVWPSEGPR